MSITTAIKIGESNHDYFCRLANLPATTGGYELAHYLGTTVEDIMCAKGDWFETLAQKARDYDTPTHRLHSAAADMAEALKYAVAEIDAFYTAAASGEIKTTITIGQFGRLDRCRAALKKAGVQ